MFISLRWISIGMISSIALFFTIISYDNIIDYDSNWKFVQHVLSMDTTFHDPAVIGRAIRNPVVQRFAYFFIIAWEIITALICWIGVFQLILKINNDANAFHHAKKYAFIGLFLGFILYMVGFIIVAGEWFSMWQSSAWNGQHTAGLFISLIMFAMLFIRYKEE